MKRRSLLTLGASTMVLAACAPSRLVGDARSGGPLEIWWSEGYYPEEADAVELIVNSWRSRTRKQVRLTFFSEKEIEARASAAARGGPRPDILYGYGLNETVLPLLAWQGMLADLSAEVSPLRDRLLPGVIRAVTYRNQRDRRQSIYAAPIAQQAVNIHYWKDLLAETGSSAGVPDRWEPFWQFWREAQVLLRRKGFNEVYGLGLPMSPLASDTANIFEYVLQGHGAQLMDGDGHLRLEVAGTRERIVAALADYTSNYREGFVPPQAVSWSDADNNISFLSSLSLMTMNPTLSIPGSQVADEITYNERLGSLDWPHCVDGTPMPSIPSIKQVAVLSDSANLEMARDFVADLLEPSNTRLFVQGSQGRFLPVLQGLLHESYWSNPRDPHLQAAERLLHRHRRQPYTVLNPAYSEVFRQNIWGRAIKAIAKDGLPVSQAADDAITAIETIVERWWR